MYEVMELQRNTSMMCFALCLNALSSIWFQETAAVLLRKLCISETWLALTMPMLHQVLVHIMSHFKLFCPFQVILSKSFQAPSQMHTTTTRWRQSFPASPLKTVSPNTDFQRVGEIKKRHSRTHGFHFLLRCAKESNSVTLQGYPGHLATTSSAEKQTAQPCKWALVHIRLASNHNVTLLLASFLCSLFKFTCWIWVWQWLLLSPVPYVEHYMWLVWLAFTEDCWQ